MKNNKILVAIIIILLIFVLILINKRKETNVVYAPQYPSPQIPNPLPPSSPIPAPTNPSSETNPQPCAIISVGNIETQYNSLKCQHSLKYGTFSSALNAFKNATGSQMEVSRIDFYVPGKLPREDGDPYFIGKGTVNLNDNDCIVGYMNLVTGVTESHHDVCVIYN